MFMEQKELNGAVPYSAPEIEITAISVEDGFANTGDEYTLGGGGSYNDFTNDNGSY